MTTPKVLSEPLTVDYVNKFHPPIVVLLKMKELLEMSEFPPYASSEQRRDMDGSVGARGTRFVQSFYLEALPA